MPAAAATDPIENVFVSKVRMKLPSVERSLVPDKIPPEVEMKGRLTSVANPVL
jgi:hypothetical protein